MKTISHGEIGNSGSYTFSLGDYEVVQVVITNGTGVRLFGDDQNATNDTFDGTAHADEIWGLDGDDEINGFDGDDLIDGGAGNDALSGGAGDDLIVGGAGSDTIDGGAGEDTLDYSDNASAVRIYAREGVAEKDESGEADAFANVEHFIGSDHDDTIFTGESTASVDSGAGKDFVRILGGDDVEVDTGDGQ